MIKKIIKKYFGILVLVSLFFSVGMFTISANEDLAEVCKIDNLDRREAELSKSDWRNLLEKCQRYYSEQETEYKKEISYLNQEERSLSNEIAYIDNRIQQLENQIYQSNLIVRDLNTQLADTKSSIGNTEERVSNYRQQLKNVLQLYYEQERHSPWESLFTGGSLFETFHQLAAAESLGNKINDLVKGTQDLQAYLEDQKNKLSQKKGELEAEVRLQSIQKTNLNSTQQQKSVLLNQAQQEKTSYQNYLNETQKKIKEIKTRLFRMVDATREITEYEAIQIAQSVSQDTGIDPAFLLAIIEQESNIGKNVGSCLLRDPETGDGVYVTGEPCDNVMKNTPRSWENTANTDDFLAITEQLGMDWQETPVSCPAPQIYSSYGGAMGPAQFIPSTWMSYKYKVEGFYNGDVVANPWIPEHAFLAAASYLRDLGANGTWRSQFTAAGHYYGCLNCSYRYQVMDRVDKWRNKIRLVQ